MIAIINFVWGEYAFLARYRYDGHNTEHACMQEEYSSVLICYNRKTVCCQYHRHNFINNACNLKHSDVLSWVGGILLYNYCTIIVVAVENKR